MRGPCSSCRNRAADRRRWRRDRPENSRSLVRGEPVEATKGDGGPASRGAPQQARAWAGVQREQAPCSVWRPVDRMARVQRPPVQADIGAEAVHLDEPLRGVVTFLAERLERAEPEFVDVAMVRLDVIADRCRRNDAALQAVLTKRVYEQLVLPDPGPPR